MGNINTPQENLPEYMLVDTKLNQLACDIDAKIVETEEKYILSQFECRNNHNFQLVVKREAPFQNDFFVLHQDTLLNIPLKKEELLNILITLNTLIESPHPIYIDGKFHFRVIAQDDNWWDYNSTLFQDTVLVKEIDLWNGRAEREYEIAQNNNYVEELFKFAQEIRNNSQDHIYSRILDKNWQIWFWENSNSQEIAKLVDQNTGVRIAQNNN